MSEQISTDQFRAWLLAFADRIREQEDYLTQLDAAIGDADHGINMQRGMEKLRERLVGEPAPAPVWGAVRRLGSHSSPVAAPRAAPVPPADEREDELPNFLRSVGMVLISHVGGASGPLYGSFFLSAAKEALDLASSTAEPLRSVTLPQLARLFRSGAAGVQQRGKAQPGDKTMLDALLPAVDALAQAARAGDSLDGALRAASQAAHDGMVHSTALQARRGRASYLGPRSIGHQDPGATSTYYLFEAAISTLGGEA